MIVARARHEDLPAILELEQEGFDAARWSLESWEAELAADDRCVLAVRDFADHVIAVATFQSVADTADLHRVVVAPEHRSRGIGAQLVRAGMQWAQALGALKMLLEVRQDNQVAIRLYQRLGFQAIAQRPDYYGPGQHAVVMSHDLAQLKPANDVWGLHV